MKQIGLKKITGKIVVKTGLHIGAGNDKVEIGGMDNPIIRNPLTREPYIPGSSLKGKMRSLMEWKLGKLKDTDGKHCSCGDKNCEVCRVFGAANNNDKISKERGPTRLIVRDAVLSSECAEKFRNGNAIVEEKSENNLNRITAAAVPRQLERVVPGVEFDLDISYRVIDTNDGGEKDEEYFKKVVLQSLALLESDYLGGGGTRGNGQIEFKDLKDENNKEIVLPKLSQ